jgi:hypothetical protein
VPIARPQNPLDDTAQPGGRRGTSNNNILELDDLRERLRKSRIRQRISQFEVAAIPEFLTLRATAGDMDPPRNVSSCSDRTLGSRGHETKSKDCIRFSSADLPLAIPSSSGLSSLARKGCAGQQAQEPSKRGHADNPMVPLDRDRGHGNHGRFDFEAAPYAHAFDPKQLRQGVAIATAGLFLGIPGYTLSRHSSRPQPWFLLRCFSRSRRISAP